MKRRDFLSILCLAMAGTACNACSTLASLKTAKKNVFNVLSFNIWQEGTQVENGFDYIVDNIVALEPDLVGFEEIRNYNNTDFIAKVLESLGKRGKTYYGSKSNSTGIISKTPIEKLIVIPMPPEVDCGSAIKLDTTILGKKITFYAIHLDYRHYACYLPRGYDGYTWKKMEKPITDPVAILEHNQKSWRDEALKTILDDAEEHRKQGRYVVICGDFNEPSHLDWQENTKNLWDHRGAVVNWGCSMMLAKKKYVDSFRRIYPDPCKNPGFTFPSNNLAAPLEKLAWAPESDERDRIDFIYYHPEASGLIQKLTVIDSKVVAPKGEIIRGKRAEEDGDDTVIDPENGWPTDHKAVLSTFRFED